METREETLLRLTDDIICEFQMEKEEKEEQEEAKEEEEEEEKTGGAECRRFVKVFWTTTSC